MGSSYKRRKYNSIPQSIPSPSISLLENDILQPKHSLLCTFFAYIDRFILFYYGKKITSFENIKSYIEKLSKKKFTIEHLEKIKTIYPSAYDYSIQKIMNDDDILKRSIVIKFPLKFSHFKDMDQYINKRLKIFKENLKEMIKTSKDIERSILIDNNDDYKNIYINDDDDDNDDNINIDLSEPSLNHYSMNKTNQSFDENDENALLDRIILGKDHPLIMNKGNGLSYDGNNFIIEPIPESLKDINPTVIYKARQNKKNMDIVNDEEYIKKENKRRIYLFIKEICEKMNRYIFIYFIIYLFNNHLL